MTTTRCVKTPSTRTSARARLASAALGKHAQASDTSTGRRSGQKTNLDKIFFMKVVLFYLKQTEFEFRERNTEVFPQRLTQNNRFVVSTKTVLQTNQSM